MSAKQAILTEEERLSIREEKDHFYENDNGLKLDGSRQKQAFVKNIQKLIMVLAHEFFNVPEIAHEYNFAQPKSNMDRQNCLGLIYQKLCLRFTTESGPFFDTPEFKHFASEKISPWLSHFDATKFALPTLSCKTTTSKTGFIDV